MAILVFVCVLKCIGKYHCVILYIFVTLQLMSHIVLKPPAILAIVCLLLLYCYSYFNTCDDDYMYWRYIAAIVPY